MTDLAKEPFTDDEVGKLYLAACLMTSDALRGQMRLLLTGAVEWKAPFGDVETDVRAAMTSLKDFANQTKPGKPLDWSMIKLASVGITLQFSPVVNRILPNVEAQRLPNHALLTKLMGLTIAELTSEAPPTV